MKYIITFLAIFSFAIASTTSPAQPVHKYGYTNKKVGDKYFVRKANEQKQNAAKKVNAK